MFSSYLLRNMSDKVQIIYDREDSIRLDKFLAGLKMQELYSRTFIEHLIEEDRIIVNKIPVKKSYLLNKGDEIEISIPELPPTEIVPQNIPLEVVYEDEDLAVINKAAGMIVHPGYGIADHTLVNAMVYRWGEKLSRGREINRPGIVHRLDRGTSGLMIIAKNDPAQSALCEMLSRREIKKTYLAITCGIPHPSEGTIETNISRSINNPRKMCVNQEGRRALTHYKVIRFYNYYSLIKVGLETGRMHQIRVHFAHLNTPILGDLLYNSLKQAKTLAPENMKHKVSELLTEHLLRQALHSWRVEFTHPISGKHLDIKVEPPEDFQYTFRWLEQYFSLDSEAKDLKTILEENEEW